MTEKPNYNLCKEKPPKCPECAYWGISREKIPIWGWTFRWRCEDCGNRWSTVISCKDATLLTSSGKKFHISEDCAGSSATIKEEPFLEVIKKREPCGNCVSRCYLACYEEHK